MLIELVCLINKGGCLIGDILAPLSNIFIFAGEQSNMCALSWHTSPGAESGLCLSYKTLKVGNSV